MNYVEISLWSTAVFIPTFFLIFLILRTPALDFLKASFKKKMLLIHPRQDRYAEIISVDRFGNLAYIKNHGYYLINPNHVFIEPKSRTPIAIVYGNLGVTVDPKVANAAELLAKTYGVSNFLELKALIDEMRKNKVQAIKLLGETVNLEDLEKYFASTERSDFIEAEIQRRTAAQVIQRLRTPENWFKWAIILAVIMIAAAVAYVIITSGSGGQAMQAIQSIASGITGQPAPQTNATGIIIK